MERVKIILFIFSLLFVINKNCLAESFTGNMFKFNSKLPVKINSDLLEIDASKNNIYIFYYQKNVVLIQGNNKIYSDKLTIFYDKNSKKIIKAIIDNNVKIKGNNIICSCDNGLYLFNKQKIILKGNVKILQNNNIFYGDELEIDMKNNKTYLKSNKKSRINTYFSGEK